MVLEGFYTLSSPLMSRKMPRRDSVPPSPTTVLSNVTCDTRTHTLAVKAGWRN